LRALSLSFLPLSPIASSLLPITESGPYRRRVSGDPVRRRGRDLQSNRSWLSAPFMRAVWQNAWRRRRQRRLRLSHRPA
jgi:hypothetical protein